MTNKSYGQVAYEAYGEHTDFKSIITGDALPQWDDLNKEIRRAWEAAGEAVISKFDEILGECH
jgi:hypothetical protein